MPDSVLHFLLRNNQTLAANHIPKSEELTRELRNIRSTEGLETYSTKLKNIFSKIKNLQEQTRPLPKVVGDAEGVGGPHVKWFLNFMTQWTLFRDTEGTVEEAEDMFRSDDFCKRQEGQGTTIDTDKCEEMQRDLRRLLPFLPTRDTRSFASFAQAVRKASPNIVR